MSISLIKLAKKYFGKHFLNNFKLIDSWNQLPGEFKDIIISPKTFDLYYKKGDFLFIQGPEKNYLAHISPEGKSIVNSNDHYVSEFELGNQLGINVLGLTIDDLVEHLKQEKENKMKNIVKLTESDLVRLVKRVINEQQEEATIGEIIHNPRIERTAEQVVNQMSRKDLNDLKNAFSMLGVSPSSSFGEIKNAVENLQQDDDDSNEITEDEEMSQKKKTWLKVKGALFLLGVGNAALFFTPFSMLFDKLLELNSQNQASMEWSGILSALLLIIGSEAILGSDKKQ